MILTRGAYRPRSIRSLGVLELSGWQVKLYGIAWRGEQPRQQLIRAATRTAARALPAPIRPPGEPGADRYGLGFCVIHDASDRCFVLCDWWAAENELHQRMFSAPLDAPDALAPHPSEAIGCVWELEVVDFERRAWRRHVLADPGGPDEAAYLRATFNGRV